MQRIVAFLLGLIFAFSASAADVGPRRALLAADPPSWVLRGNGVPATIDLNFAQGIAYAGNAAKGARIGPPNAYITTVRAISGTGHVFDYAADTSGNYVGFGANVPRITNAGLLVEESRTNSALRARDMTQAVWVAVNVTTALNAVGIDGTSNAASTLTAISGNGTILQTATLAAGSDTVSVFLKRVTGSGTINITGNGGISWTACPTLTTTVFTRCTLSASLGLNPIVGLQIVTNSDAIIVDGFQLEPGIFATSPIFTTSAAVTRNADVVTLTRSPVFGSAYTLSARGIAQAPAAYAVSQNILESFYLNISQRSLLRRQQSTGAVLAGTVGGTGVFPATGGTFITGASGAVALALAAGDQAASFNGAIPGTTSGASLPTTPVSVAIGANSVTTEQWNGTISRVTIWPTIRLPNPTLQSITVNYLWVPGVFAPANDNLPTEAYRMVG